MRESAAWRTARGLALVAFGIFFLFPLLSMLEFSTRVINGGGRTLGPWENLFRDEALRTSIITSLLLALLTTLLMLVEYLCLLPLTIPPLVIVVGISNVYAWVTYLLGDSPLTLTFAYVVLVLPYAYRALDSALASINVVTLAEAARSLGAGWSTVITRVVLPNIWGGVTSAAFVAVALVLGEYTFASLLNFETMPYVIGLLGKSDAPTSVAASLASLIFASALLIALSFLGRRNRSSKGA